ncbi:MAG: polysaccharide biosynthesis tyrosine autokinase, partial [Phycisphaerales bacterium]|nr:polysaccharide biosynthesis tyrosine autokinase [Phycisphaerales bacterium]
PIKLLKKYALLLVVAAGIGGGLGLAAHLVLLRTFPTFVSYTRFECELPQEAIGDNPYAGRTDENEFERFMLNQVNLIKSDTVLDQVVNDPRLPMEASGWHKQFVDNGNYDRVEALETLQEEVSARVESGTSYIRIQMGWRDKQDVTAVVSLVRRAYQDVLQRQVNLDSTKLRNALSESIKDLDTAITNLTNQRSRMLAENNVDSIDERSATARYTIGMVNGERIEIAKMVEAMKIQLQAYEQQLDNPAGIAYPDSLVAQVDMAPLIQRIKQQISDVETETTSAKISLGPTHRYIKQLNSRLEGLNQELKSARATQLLQSFNALVDDTRRTLREYEAQDADLLAEVERLNKELIDLTSIQAQISDIDEEIDRLIIARSERKNELDNFSAIIEKNPLGRVVLREQERIPDKVAFPNIMVMIPAGVLLTVGLVGGWVVMREVVDQRVKGPADIALIPRTTLLGLIPDAAEDPTHPAEFATVFRDEPRSVTAEAFRQLRAPLLKQMEQNQHRSLLVVGGMPRSGSTGFTTNLGLACAASGKRVLLIDANFRRPALHKTLDAQESPGLADVLATQASLSSCVQSTQDANLDLLSAGTAEQRVFEHLATEHMSRLLAEAGATYDLILVDVAPAVVAGDAAALANRVDASILVVRALSEKRGLVARLRSTLTDARAQFFGVVVNGVRSSAGGYFKHNIKATHAYHDRS